MAFDTPNSLVKFCSADTARKILSSKSLRWSAPHLFKDPFELDTETQLAFGPEDLLSVVLKAASNMIFSPAKPVGNTPLVNAIRRWREEERFHTPEEAQDVLKELLGRMVDHQLQILDDVMTDWRKYARTLRICSFCDKPTNLAAWQHFAHDHRGIAIEFMVDEYATIKDPKKVSYEVTPPEITSLKEQMDAVINHRAFDAQSHFEKKFTSKAKANHLENEWRCLKTVEDTFGSSADSAFEDVKLEQNDIKAIYFGINMPMKNKKVLLDIARENFSKTKIYETKVKPGSYELQFDLVKK
ncbi:MAG: DUF2971 domain-containing protein [Cellvibrionaceae bacterium]